MKIKRHRAPLVASAAQQDDSTPEIEARTEPTVHRRTTVTVERETLSVVMRRSSAAPVSQPQGEGSMHEPQTQSLAEVSNDLTGEKP